ncbi:MULTISPECIES: bifunctional 2-polyprenyl-6-hydroxyphenol methylase/3-demethylubiquinol 3-O-methyltransferase UbiG [unclassified Amycolatopsis]|uniref:class I SAM-dependent methyltransferase n=1 Tax=unclassified Amycolatopsis TaxID=2618356 RepID=UPI00106E55CC|nr:MULTISPECIES: class I SAM-dependent methyltransferase [unclassified Amycolatopsis]
MTSEWTNEAAIRQWHSASTRESMEATAEHADFAKRQLVNPVLLRLLGDVRGRRVLDAGCGNGYFSRMLARRGAEVTGVEPAESLLSFAREKSADVSYLQADLARLPELEPFDAVVCSMVLMAIPDWKPAMRACVEALRLGGLFVFAIVHPAFEELFGTWQKYGEYRRQEYLAEYEIAGRDASDFHRPISAYLNEMAALGCRLREVVEPGLDPAVAEGIESYVRMPNFLIVAAEAS